jgi:predicted deacylase
MGGAPRRSGPARLGKNCIVQVVLALPRTGARRCRAVLSGHLRRGAAPRINAPLPSFLTANQVARLAMHIELSPLAAPALGTARELTSFHYGPADAGCKVVIQSSIHADETPGMLVSYVLKQRLAQLEKEGRLRARIVVVPVANPIGLDQNVNHALIGRFELGSGQNFNRNFHDIAALVGDALEAVLTQDAQHNRQVLRQAVVAALARQTPRTELDALRLALQKLSADADLVLDLHCSLEAVVHIFTHDAAWPEFEPLARFMGAQAVLLATDSGGFSFDEALNLGWWRLQQRFAGRFPIPAVPQAACVELRGLYDVSYELAEQDAEAILRYLSWRGAIAGARPAAPPLRYAPTPLSGADRVEAPVSGVVVYRAPLGAWVNVGDPIADIVDPLTDVVTTLTSRSAGVVFTRRVVRFVTAGASIAEISGTHTLRAGKLLSA